MGVIKTWCQLCLSYSPRDWPRASCQRSQPSTGRRTQRSRIRPVGRSFARQQRHVRLCFITLSSSRSPSNHGMSSPPFEIGMSSQKLYTAWHSSSTTCRKRCDLDGFLQLMLTTSLASNLDISRPSFVSSSGAKYRWFATFIVWSDRSSSSQSSSSFP